MSATPIAADDCKDHIRDMRKYHNQNHVAYWGGAPVRMRAEQHRSLQIVHCKHFSATANVTAAFWEGMRSLDLFPSQIQIIDCFDKDGLKADWIRVGSDLKVGMQLWREAEKGPDKEFEAA